MSLTEDHRPSDDRPVETIDCPPRTEGARCLDTDPCKRTDIVEIARRRAVLAGQVAHHHFRLLSALKAASEYARRIGRLDIVGDLEHQRGVVAGFSTQVSAEADDTHNLWAQLRGTNV